MGNVVILMSNEPELRMRRVCFTGHRPEKLNKSEVEIVASLERETALLSQTVSRLSSPVWPEVLTSGCRGCPSSPGQWLSDSSDCCKPPIRALNVHGRQHGKVAMLRHWPVPISSVSFLRSMIVAASNAAMNGWSTMPGRVIAVFNGEKGGTKNTIDYAKRHHVPVIYIP